MNPFITIRKKQRYIAMLLLNAVAFSEARAFVNPSEVAVASTAAVGAPVAASASEYVDPFTGDFNYSVPLMTVPGPNGENVPITASYHAGIRMNQSASWIGLGWDYNPGEISRQVNGAPDDNNGKVTYSASFDLPSTTTYHIDNAIYGPMYYNAAGTPNYTVPANSTANYGCDQQNRRYMAHDLFLSSNNEITYNLGGLSSNNRTVYFPFAQADYDNYSISGSGIRGSLQPYTKSTIMLKNEKTPAQGLSNAGNSIKQMQFYFSRAADMSATAIESSTNRVKTGYFVRYLTNEQLNNATTCDTVGFIDYRDTTDNRRPSSNFEADGIGAYQVTTPGGVTYHYSLPVYTNDEQYISFGLTSSAFDRLKRIDIYRKRYKYATSWKLTAITGPDFVDNGNNILDAGDKGYWIAYDYSLWCNDYKWSSSPYGFKKDLQLKSIAKTFSSPVYGQRGSVTSGSSQQYYIDRIRTLTHTAWFVKSLRKDEQSMDHLYNSSDSPKAQLKLDRIILLRSEDAGLFNGSASVPGVSGYTTNGCNANMVHNGIYSANEASINAASLKSVELETDYSLCKKYYTNIANTVTATDINFDYHLVNPNMDTVFSESNLYGTNIGHAHPTSVSTSSSDASNTGGKLTLNKIKVYEEGKQAIYPSYDFTYNTSNNPDYDCDKVDIWGFYKSDYVSTAGKRSYYTTSTSKDYLDAWSLKDITTPLGGEIHVNYEADRYTYEEGYGAEHLPYFIHLVDGRSVTSDPSAVSFANESDYISSYVKRKLVMPNFMISCAELPAYYEVTESGTTQYIPDPMNTDCSGSTITNAYNPTDATTEWGWSKNSVAIAYGGGIRVKDIIIEDPESAQSFKQEYTYENGLCTYKPDRFKVEGYHLTENRLQNERDNGPAMVGYGKVTTKTIDAYGQDNGKVEYLFNIDYSPSSVSGHLFDSQSNEIPTGYFKDSCAFTGSYTSTCQIYEWKDQYSISLQKKIGSFDGFGQSIKKSVYDKTGALISYSQNFYQDVSEVSELFLKESKSIRDSTFFTVRNICGSPTGTTLPGGTHITLCGSSRLPFKTFCNKRIYSVAGNTISRKYTILSKTESYSNGITTTSIVNERDPVSMQPLSSTVIDPTQGAITTTIKPAYTNTVSYSGMGLKSACPTCAGNENMVSLVEEQRVIKQPVFRNTDGVITYNNAGPGILMGASKQTYANSVYHRKYNTSTNKYESVSESAGTWLPYESYTALTNASTPSTTTTPTWKKTNTVTLFTTTNKALESEGMSGRRSAVKFGYKNLYPLSSISDANYNCFGFTGFEDTLNVGTAGSPVWHFGGEFSRGTMRQAGTDWIKPHTGYYVAAVPASSIGPELLLNGYEKGRTYRASVWVHKNSPANAKLVIALDGSVSGTPYYDWQEILKSNVNNITVGDWTLMSVQLTVPESFAESGGTTNNSLSISVWNGSTTTAWFDDLMVRPVDAPITGTVYDPKTARVIATLDNENFASWFEYDAAGRVTATYVETRLGVKKTSETQYNFSRNN